MTWLPTVVFAVLSRVGGWEFSCGWVIYLGPTLTALVLVPPVWWEFVGHAGRHRVRRGALAGAALALMVFASSMQIASAWFWAHNRFPTDAFGEGMGNGLSSLYILGSLIIGAPVGAAVGALIAYVQGRWLNVASAAPARAVGLRDGAMGGALVAVLAGPAGGLLAALVLPPSMQPLMPHGGTDVNVMLFDAWLVMVPVGAALGALGLRRWRRIQGPTAAT